MKSIVIIGAGDLGKELVWLIEDMNKREPAYLILGFLDDDLSKVGKEFYGYKILGTTEKLDEMWVNPQISAVAAIQDGSVRRKIYEAHKNFQSWDTIIHPAATIAPTAILGSGSVVFPHVTISVDSRLGEFGLYYINSTICNDCKIGNYVSVMTSAVVSEHVEIGDESYLAAGCCVYPHKVIGKRVQAAVGATIDKNCSDNAVINGRNGGFLLFK